LASVVKVAVTVIGRCGRFSWLACGRAAARDRANSVLGTPTGLLPADASIGRKRNARRVSSAKASSANTPRIAAS
jgi:hypothetical protein